MRELKPCPFCGCDDIFVDDSLAPHHYIAVCEMCGAGLDHIAAWNHRPIEDAIRAENERLTEALEKIGSHSCDNEWADIAVDMAAIAREALNKGDTDD